MADTLESLEIEVKHSASDAGSEIGKVVKQIERLADAVDRALPKLNSLSKVLSGLKNTSALGKINKATGNKNPIEPQAMKRIENMSKIGVLNEKLNEAAMKMSDAKQAGNYSGAIKAREQFLRIQGQIERELAKEEQLAEENAQAEANRETVFTRLGHSLGKISGVANRASGALKSLATGSLKKLTSGFGKAYNAADKFMSGLKRILFYRILRTIIKELGEAFTEGLQNAYQFSAGVSGTSHRFAEAMDSMSSSTLSMKNQLGSAFIALLAAVAPVVNAIISLITRLADALAQLISAFTGITYLKAGNVTKKFADATASGAKAAKEWKNQLMGFDEINRLEEPSDTGGGGGSSALDPSSMFQESEIAKGFIDFANSIKAAIRAGDWAGAGKLIGEKINSIFPTNDKWAAWGSKLGKGLGGAITMLYNALNTIDFRRIGSGIASFIGSAITEINFVDLGGLLVRWFTLKLDFFMGFLGTLDWKEVGKAIGDFFTGALNAASEWLSTVDWAKTGENLYNGFCDLIEGIDFNALAKTFFTFLGKAFAAVALLAKGFFGDSFQSIKDFFNRQLEKTPDELIEGFKQGLKDAWSGITGWIKENIVDPFVNGFKSLFGIHSPSTVMAEVGMYVIEGFMSGLSEKWSSVTAWFNQMWDELSSWWNGLSLGAFHIPAPHFEWTYSEASGAIARALEFVGLPSTIPHLNISWYANGGFPDTGELYVARENGMSEMIGSIGGQAAVANNDQIVEGISHGVYNAVVSAIGNINERPIKVYLDGKEVRTRIKQIDRAMG